MTMTISPPRRLLLALPLLVLPWAGPAAAQETDPPVRSEPLWPGAHDALIDGLTTDLAEIPGGTYSLDRDHAQVIFMVSHLGFSRYMGRFNDLKGTLVFDPETPERSQLTVDIDIDGVDTDNGQLERLLRGEAYFDAETFPRVRFKSTAVERTGETKGRITGDLSMRGLTRPVVLDVGFNGSAVNPFGLRRTLGFSARGRLKRSDWGMTELVPVVGDEVTLIIEAEFKRTGD